MMVGVQPLPRGNPVEHGARLAGKRADLSELVALPECPT